ncbi:MAG TPA: peptide chain release factor N(5)-glutamine methyltransferase [Steroidobacteraceae bacterium]|nr:peptide chain release factor N(5)-glutamine methyltransferase [Steroidobacteraceae bacterium]
MIATASHTTTFSAWRDETSSMLEEVSDAPRLEAELLLEYVTGVSRSRQRVIDDRLTAQQLVQLDNLRRRRVHSEPLAYILEEAHFWTLKLKVTPAVLIPRPETELVIERCLHHLDNKPATVLDLGTGSGAIALAIASERPDINVTACDVSSTALDIARHNMHVLQLSNVELINSDWFKEVPTQRFNIIVSNPPYIDIDDPHVQQDVRTHEPHLALFAQHDGLHALQTIIEQASDFLHPEGWLILEHGWQQAAKVQELLESHGMRSVASHSDLAGHLRVTEAQRPAS